MPRLHYVKLHNDHRLTHTSRSKVHPLRRICRDLADLRPFDCAPHSLPLNEMLHTPRTAESDGVVPPIHVGVGSEETTGAHTTPSRLPCTVCFEAPCLRFSMFLTFKHVREYPLLGRPGCPCGTTDCQPLNFCGSKNFNEELLVHECKTFEPDCGSRGALGSVHQRASTAFRPSRQTKGSRKMCI